MSTQLPPVAPEVTAALVEALSPRLRKRLDAGIAKLADRPVGREGDTVRIAVDDTTHVELHAPGGTVTTPDAVRCGCLLAPDCLHRAAAVSSAPVAEAEPAAEAVPLTDGPAEPQDPGEITLPEPERPTPAQLTAAQAVWSAAAAVLDAGADGCGAVLQAELLRAAHTSRLAGLHRVAAASSSVVTALRAARSADPAYRLADLVAALGDVLAVSHRLPLAEGAELAALRGTARQPYRPDGSLRLYGLFTEPVLTASGYAGVVTWTADADGRLYQVSDVAPGGASRATGAADRAVRLGDTALTHRELSRAGLAVSGATVSSTGRLGAGATVRAVRAPGVDWRAEPLDGLWRVPLADQLTRALAPDSPGLLFLEVTFTGTARESAGDCLLAASDGLALRLTAAHDDPALPHRDNLRLLAAATDKPLRVIARLTPASHPRATLLATEHPTLPDTHVDVGLDRLQKADLPPHASPPHPAPLSDEPPVHLLVRRIHQSAAGGRRALAHPGTDGVTDPRRLAAHGLPTAAALLTELHSSAATRSRDAFGRLLPADPTRFTQAWLKAREYTVALDRALCVAGWSA
ncbi:hypothetical protein [Streptomyces sp. LaPpAH-108]|uniref:hypothetical protein n=1 Tax=Streptomyces sp. LaPpAH-108 TaxID=1155714 RepID=UPI00037B618F|nr:hypothetical protein [Streptomyces sp. LaPpAH-108]